MGSNMFVGGTSPSVGERYSTLDLGATTEKVASDISINTAKQLRTEELKGASISIADEQLVKMIEKANKALEGINTTFEFSVHEQTNSIMVKVLNKETGELVREIPPEKMLDMVAKMCEMAGLIIDAKR